MASEKRAPDDTASTGSAECTGDTWNGDTWSDGDRWAPDSIWASPRRPATDDTKQFAKLQARMLRWHCWEPNGPPPPDLQNRWYDNFGNRL